METFPNNSRENSMHPCDIINEFLLRTTGSSFALSHDDDWRFILKSGSSDDNGLKVIQNLPVRDIVVRSGVAFLDAPPVDTSIRAATPLLSTVQPEPPPTDPYQYWEEDPTEWLDGQGYFNDLDWALRKHIPGTGNWFLESPEFQTLLAKESAIVWGVGPSGVGKTTLSALAVRRLQQIAAGQPGVVVTYAFVEEHHTTRDIFAILLRQIGKAHDGVWRHHLDEYRATKPDKDYIASDAEELESLFSLYAEHLQRLYVVVDGLDKATPERRKCLLKTLALSGVNLLMMSTPFVQEIDPELIHDMSFVSVVTRTPQEDITLFVRQRLRQSATLSWTLDDKTLDFPKLLSAKSQRHFSLAHLHVAFLESLSITRMEEALTQINALPVDLTEMLDLTVTHIQTAAAKNNWYTNRILSWMIYAQESVVLEDIQQAMSYADDDIHSIVEGPFLTASYILSHCYGLVEVRTNQRFVFSSTRSDRVCDEIRLSHHGLKKYLLEKNLPLGPDVRNAHEFMGLRSLSLLQSKPDFQLLHRIERYIQSNAYIGHFEHELVVGGPLLAYAYHYWTEHARLSCTGRDLHPTFQAYLRNLESYPFWSDKYLPNTYSIPGEWTYHIVEGWTLAAITGCLNHIPLEPLRDWPRLIPDPPPRVSSTKKAPPPPPPRPFDRHPFMSRSHHRTDPRQIGTGSVKDHQRAFVWAAAYNRPDSVHTLLEVNYQSLNPPPASYSKDQKPDYPLLAAIVNDSRKVITELLSPSSDSAGMISALGQSWVNKADRRGRFALNLAVTFESPPEVFHLLISHPFVNVNIAQYDGQTPLMVAVEKGPKALPAIHLLLAHSSLDCNLQDVSGRTALMKAYGVFNKTRSLDVVTVLVRSRRTDLAIRDKNGWSALEWAARPCFFSPYGTIAPRSIELMEYGVKLLLRYSGWSPTTRATRVCEAAITMMTQPDLLKGSRAYLARGIRFLLCELVRKPGFSGDMITPVLAQAAKMSCRSCVPAVLESLGGPPVTLLDKRGRCTCAHCSSKITADYTADNSEMWRCKCIHCLGRPRLPSAPS